MTKLIRFLSPYKKQTALMLLLLFAQVLGTLYIPTLTANIINKGIAARDLAYVYKTGGLMLAAAAATAVVSVLGTYLSTYISTAMGRDIRGALFRKVQEFSVSDLNRFGAASLITRSTSDVTQVQMAFSIVVEMLLPAPFMTVAGLMLAFSKNAFLACMLLGFMLVILLLTALIGRRAIPVFDAMQTKLDAINRTVRESIIGVRVIRAFGRTQDDMHRMNGAFSEYARTAVRANKIFAVLLPLIMLIMNLCTICFVWFGGRQVAAGSMAIGDIMAMIEYSVLTLMYLVMGVAVFIFIPRAQTCAGRISEVLQTVPEFSQTALPAAAQGPSPAAVEFKNVAFRYPGAQEPVLYGIDFTVNRGQTTAIIGSTGSGKSTIASLLMRFFEVETGSILVDGRDLRAYSQNELRDKIGYVPQKAFLFSGTIASNLRHGKPDAAPAQMLHAVQTAQLGEFISASPQGLEHPVAQGGSNFSGGQRQRLCIARALVKQPGIYVFDDSFSALDFKTDAALRAALKSEVGGSAVILVAQRISTILDADQIIVLDEGRIVGKGTHRQLLAGCPVYQQIAHSQLSEEELA